MVSIELIGNLGADAKVVDYQGNKFVTFNVGDNRKVGDHEETTWYGCNINRYSDKLVPYLKKGQGVFVRGVPRYRVYDSAKFRCKMVGVEILVNEIQLVGAKPAEETQPAQQQAEPNANDIMQTPGNDEELPF